MTVNLGSLWVLPEDLDPELVLEDIPPGDEALLRDYEAALDACVSASQILWALSGRKYHTGTAIAEQYTVQRNWSSPTTVNPLRRSAVYEPSLGVYFVHPDDWRLRRFRLNGQPVREVASVTDMTNGRILDPSEYYVANRTVLHLNLDVGKGVEVTYTYGQQPPAMGRKAARALAQQFYYLWSGREDQCKLPDRVTSVDRQGVSWVLLDNQDFLDELKTGVYAVDLFLRSVNPDKARSKSKVFSPDVPRGNRRSI